MKQRKKRGVLGVGLELVELYGRCAIGASAAALAYFLLLTLFPLLMCVNYCIGVFHINFEQVLLSLRQFLPQQVLSVLMDYLWYASRSQSGAVLLAALSTIVLSASAGLRNLLYTMDRIYGVRPTLGIKRVAESVVLSVLLMLTVYLSLAVMLTGEWFFQLLEARLPRSLLAGIPLAALSGLWLGLRYVLLFSAMLLMVLLVYWAGSPSWARDWQLLISALVTAGAMVGSSAVFSWVIGLSVRYSLVYGSLASMVVLLAWLYFCGNILLLGAAAGQIWRGRYCQTHRDWLQ